MRDARFCVESMLVQLSWLDRATTRRLPTAERKRLRWCKSAAIKSLVALYTARGDRGEEMRSWRPTA